MPGEGEKTVTLNREWAEWLEATRRKHPNRWAKDVHVLYDGLKLLRAQLDNRSEDPPATQKQVDDAVKRILDRLDRARAGK